MSRHRIPIFASSGRFVVKHLPPKAIQHQLELGAVVYNAAKRQYRLVPQEAEKPSHPTPSGITFQEMEDLVGMRGPTLQKRAQDKLYYWNRVS